MSDLWTSFRNAFMTRNGNVVTGLYAIARSLDKVAVAITASVEHTLERENGGVQDDAQEVEPATEIKND